MTKKIFKVAFFTLLFILPIYQACSQKNVIYKNVDSKEFSQGIKQAKAILLDVRTMDEFKNGHLKNSGQLNYYALDFRKKLLLLPPDQPVFLYCNTGYRSRKAAEILTENGYTKVYNLEHGILEWELKNYPVQIEPDAKPDKENNMEPDEYLALTKSNQVVFIDFYAPWCAPCKQMMPAIDSLKTQYNGKITLVKINVDASKKLVKDMKIVSVPYLLAFNRGEKIFEKYGAMSRKELDELFINTLTN
jgi:thioredoxin